MLTFSFCGYSVSCNHGITVWCAAPPCGILAREATTMKTPKAMTIRLSQEQAEELETVASVDDKPVAEVIRAAIAEHISARKQDKNFRQSLQQRIERTQQMLK
jgi:predicted transcriptional regulator